MCSPVPLVSDRSVIEKGVHSSDVRQYILQCNKAMIYLIYCVWIGLPKPLFAEGKKKKTRIGI